MQSPRRVVTRPISTRAPSLYKQKRNPSPSYAYSPRPTTRKTSPYTNIQPKKKYNQSMSVYGSNKKSRETQKKQTNVNWMSSLKDIQYQSPSKPSNSRQIVPPSASLLFPSPSSPVTRTPRILREIIDDSGFKILRESPLSASDSFYAKDIVEQSSIQNIPEKSRPYSMNANINESQNKTFLANTSKSERLQRPTKISFKINSDSKNDSTKTSIEKVQNNGKVQFDFQEEKEDKKLKKEDLEKLFDLSDFNVDKFDNSKLDANEDLSKITNDEDDTKVLDSIQSEINLNEDLQYETPKIKLPADKPTNQARIMSNNKDINLNKTAETTSKQKVQNSNNETDTNQFYIDDMKNSPITANSDSNIKSTETANDYSKSNQIDDLLSFLTIENESDISDESDELFDEEDKLYVEKNKLFDLYNSDSKSESTVSDQEEPICIDIFGDIDNFLYSKPRKNQNQAIFNQENNYQTQRSDNGSAFSSYRQPTPPLRSSFKKENDDEKSSPKSGRKSVKFILPE